MESESRAKFADTPERISSTFSSPGSRIGRVCLRMIWMERCVRLGWAKGGLDAPRHVGMDVRTYERMPLYLALRGGVEKHLALPVLVAPPPVHVPLQRAHQRVRVPRRHADDRLVPAVNPMIQRG